MGLRIFYDRLQFSNPILQLLDLSSERREIPLDVIPEEQDESANVFEHDLQLLVGELGNSGYGGRHSSFKR